MLRTRVTLITLLHSPDSCLCHGIASASFKITGCLRSRFISLVSSPRSRPIVRESVLSVCRAMTLPFNPFIDRWRASVCRAFKNSLEITRERGPGGNSIGGSPFYLSVQPRNLPLPYCSRIPDQLNVSSRPASGSATIFYRCRVPLLDE